MLIRQGRLYCGFENGIECFDVANPGANGTRHMLSPSRKAKQGQKGEAPDDPLGLHHANKTNVSLTCQNRAHINYSAESRRIRLDGSGFFRQEPLPVRCKWRGTALDTLLEKQRSIA